MKTAQKPAISINGENKPKQHERPDERMRRREFLCKSGVMAVGLGLSPSLSTFAEETKSTTSAVAKLGWKISVQHYTYRRFSLFDALEKAAEVGLQHIEIRSNLRLDATRPGMKADENMSADARDEFKARLADNGMSVPSVFADFNGKPDQAKRLFEFWKGLSTEIIVAEPPAGSFDTLEQLCEEYKMRLALHNHQKGRSNYWSPEIVLDACTKRSKRIGACADGGQWARSGLDPVECLRKLKGRIINFHIKDILKKGEPDSRNTVIGEGQADCAKSLRELKILGYKGPIVIDFEHDTPALQEDMAHNVAFIKEQARQLLAQ